MRDQLSLALTGEILTLTLSQAELPRGWSARLRWLLNRTPAQAHTDRARAANKLVVTRPVDQLSATLEAAWENLKKQGTQDSLALDFSVQLGLAHARLGLLHLSEEGVVPAKPVALDTYVQAWVRQMWGMDPATQIIRWDRLEHGGGILISCIDRSVYVELETFARRHGLRFVSCKPAVLGALDLSAPSGENDAASSVIAWTEPSIAARRSPLVQLLHCHGSQPKALWRGWLPVPDAIDESDNDLHGALRRFMAAGKLPMNSPAVFMHWDQALQPPQGTGAST